MYTPHMRVMGIDCGGEYTGFGVVEQVESGDLVCLEVGAIRLVPQDRLELRLDRIFCRLTEIIERNRPEVVAIEDVFYAANAKTALKLGHVRGVAMLSAASFELPVAEYAPLSIKSAVVGYGKADKVQVQEMVKRLLRLAEVPQPSDVADALALAICHLHTAATL